MTKLEELRIQINKIDDEMRILFEKRLELIKGVKQYKLENNIPVLDASREAQIIADQLSKLSDATQSDEYTNFLNCIFDISKRIQSK